MTGIDTSESRKYQPYQPTKWQQRIDNAIGIVAPATAMRRMVTREKMNWFRYLAAQPTSARQNSNPTTTGEWLRIQREKLQVMWNAIDMVDNSGLCSGILIKFPTYVCGTLGWQARTGDKGVNKQYQQYIKEKTTKPGNIDITRRFTLRQMCMADVKCIALKGDVGTNIVREDDEIYLQGIEANRIGDPYKYVTSQTYVRGLVLDASTGRIDKVQVFYQDKRSGFYRFDDEYPMRDKRGLPQFLFFANPIPISYDDYRGVSIFKHAIDNATYIDRMRQYELQALMWAAAQSGVYHTKSGALPDALPFDKNRLQDRDGNFIDTYEVRPNTVTALGEGEDVTMFQHDRPSPNVIGMYENTVRDIAIGAGFTYGFAYDMTGITGPAVRQCSAQDARSIETWQSMLAEQKLDPVIMLLLGEAIAKKELPYHPNWMQWAWFFPAKPTIDAGRESDANIEEIGAGVNTGANVVAEAGLGDVDDVITQNSHETEAKIEAAQDVAKRLKLDWQDVYLKMYPPKAGSRGGSPMQQATAAGDKVKKNGKDAPGATDDPEDLSDEKMSQNGNGHRDGPYIIQKFYERQQFDAESGKTQDRDSKGKFAPEGKGKPASPDPNHPTGGRSDEGYVINPNDDLPGAERAKIKEQQDRQSDVDAGGGHPNDDIPRAAMTDDEAINELYNPADADKYRELKKQWATVNATLLQYAHNPDTPDAEPGLMELNRIVKEMHQLHADPGGDKGIGLPGGPRDIIVIGAGPGGLSTAIQAGTDGLDATFIDTQPITGGQSKMSSRVENYPGFPIGISGEELAKRMYEQAVTKGAEAKLETQVTGLSYDAKTGIHTVKLSDGTSMEGRSVVIAGGVQFRELPGFEETNDSGIVYGDGKKMSALGAGKNIVVYGGSNGAAQAALGASRTANHVYVLSRSPLGKSMSDYQIEALKANPKITIIENDSAKAFEYNEGKPVALETTGGKRLDAEVLGIFAGSAPNTKWLPPEIATVTDKGPTFGKIKVDENLNVVNDKGEAIPGVYAVGDIREGSIQRILASAAEGQLAERHIAVELMKRLGVESPEKNRDASIEQAKAGMVT